MCPLSAASVLLRDTRPEVRREQGHRRQLRFRRAARATAQVKKKSKNAQPVLNSWASLPYLSPYLLFKAMVHGGLVNHWLLIYIYIMHILCSCATFSRFCASLWVTILPRSPHQGRAKLIGWNSGRKRSRNHGGSVSIACSLA